MTTNSTYTSNLPVSSAVLSAFLYVFDVPRLMPLAFVKCLLNGWYAILCSFAQAIKEKFLMDKKYFKMLWIALSAKKLNSSLMYRDSSWYAINFECAWMS